MDLYFKNKTKYYPNETEPEFFVQFIERRGKIKIKVHKNKTLIKEKEKIVKHNKNKLMFENVIVMFSILYLEFIFLENFLK